MQGTNSSTKHELLFSRFQINYNEISARFRKGSVIIREEVVSNAANNVVLLLISNIDARYLLKPILCDSQGMTLSWSWSRHYLILMRLPLSIPKAFLQGILARKRTSRKTSE